MVLDGQVLSGMSIGSKGMYLFVFIIISPMKYSNHIACFAKTDSTAKNTKNKAQSLQNKKSPLSLKKIGAK